MKQDVLITLRGTQTRAQEEPQFIELITGGTMTGRNGKYAISYEETEVSGTKGVVDTFLIFNPKRIVLTREGSIRSRMVFEEDRKNEALYDLGFGSLLVSISARHIEVDLSDSGGRLQIDYTVEIEQTISSHNSYELIIEPVKKQEEKVCAETTAP